VTPLLGLARKLRNAIAVALADQFGAAAQEQYYDQPKLRRVK
jgi:hypothetical protein